MTARRITHQGATRFQVGDARAGPIRISEAAREGRHPIREWIVAVVGLVLVAGVIGFLLFEASARGPIAPGCEALGDFSD